MKSTKIFAPIVAALAWLAISAPAQPPRLSLVTILPGQALYSSFGHSAIRLREGGRGRDILYNFGLSAKPFDLRFALNMLAGRMEFKVGALDTEETLDYYREVENRGIVEQSLELDAGREAELIGMLRRAALPKASVYNYRYFTDNCATRPAAMLRSIVGDASPPFAGESSKTLRSSVAEVLRSRPWLGLAIDAILGPRADRPIPDGPIFLPEDLMRWAARASYPSPGGRTALVAGAETLYAAKKAAVGAAAFSPLLASLLIVVLALAASIFPAGLAPLRRAFDAALFALAFLPGLAILVLWLCAGYAEAGMNLNLLWAGPLPLLALALGRMNPHNAPSVWLFRIAAAAALTAALGGGWGLQSMPLEARLLASSLFIRSAAGSRRTGRVV